jgi:hypothetical protein
MEMSGIQRGRLRVAIQIVYQGPNAADLFWQFLLEQLDVDLFDLTSAKVEFPLQITEALAKLNASGKAAELLDRLEQAHPQAGSLLQVISQLRAEARPVQASAEAEARLRALEGDYLLLDGLPFINRSRLRSMLDDLFDPANPARVGIVAGTALSGKTWSLHLIRAYCKARLKPKVRRIFLDLERLQPENDPLVVWTELMTQLCRPQPPPAAPPADTKGGQYVQRLVDEVSKAWEAWEAPGLDEKPWLLVVFDHIEKKAAPAVGPMVVDFAEALAMAAVERQLEGGRVLLLGFPRGFSPKLQGLHVAQLAPREDISPLTLAEVKGYLRDVGKAIGRGAPPEVEAAADSALREAEATSLPEERRAVLLKMSATIGSHVSVLARAI